MGAGGYGKVIADLATEIAKWDSIAFLDDFEKDDVLIYPVLGKLSEYKNFTNEYFDAFAAMEDNSSRLRWICELNMCGYNLPALIHPRSFVSRFSIIRKGTAVLAGSVVGPNVQIGKGCIIHSNSVIEHDCVIEDGAHIFSGSCIEGAACIGKKAEILSGTQILAGLRAGDESVVRARAVVSQEVRHEQYPGKKWFGE